MKNQVLKFIVIPFVFLLSLSNMVIANDSREKDNSGDLGLATIWIMNEITQGGYLKPSMNLTVFDSDPKSMWEIEGGWRFTNWFKLGFSLESSISEVDRINNRPVLIGFVTGASGRHPTLGYFTVDLNFGAFEIGDFDNTPYFIEPGFHIKRRLYKRLYWTSGITYRYVEDESLALFGSNSFNSISLKLGLTGNRY